MNRDSDFQGDYELFQQLEEEYMIQFPKSEKLSMSNYELGLGTLLEGLKNRNGRKIRIVLKRDMCDGGKIVYYTPNKN